MTFVFFGGRLAKVLDLGALSGLRIMALITLFALEGKAALGPRALVLVAGIHCGESGSRRRRW